MILLHRLHGEPVFVNADLIESIEATPDTLISLVDGRKAIVTESPQEVARRVIEFRAAVLVAADHLRDQNRPVLSAVPDPER